MDRRYGSGVDIQLFVGVDQTLESSVNWSFGQPDPANVDKGSFAILQLENGVILTDLFLKKSRNVKIRDRRCQECLIGSIGIVMPKINGGFPMVVMVHELFLGMVVFDIWCQGIAGFSSTFGSGFDVISVLV